MVSLAGQTKPDRTKLRDRKSAQYSAYRTGNGFREIFPQRRQETPRDPQLPQKPEFFPDMGNYQGSSSASRMMVQHHIPAKST